MVDRSIVVSGLVTGTLVGVIAGVLLAPKSGRVTRRFLKSKANRLQDYISNLCRKQEVSSE